MISTTIVDGPARRRARLWAAALLAAAGNLGCAASDPLVVWQTKLTRYIAEEGRGDASVLRELPQLRAPHDQRPARITFGALDIPGPGLPPFCSRTDVQGVLVGVAPAVPQPWYYFLVGVMEHSRDRPHAIRDIRLIGVQVKGRKLHAQVSAENPAALQQYLQGAARRTEGRPDPGIFPTPWDDFAYAASPEAIRVTEQHSSATWTMRTPEGGRGQVAAGPVGQAARGQAVP